MERERERERGGWEVVGQYRLLLLLATRVASSTVDDVRKAKPKWRTQRHAHSCYKSCGSPPPFHYLHPPLFYLLLSFTALVCLLVRPFSCSYVNYCLSARCPLPPLSSSTSPPCPLSLFTTLQLFFGSHTHTCTLYTLVPFRILLHILFRLLFLPSFACLSLLLKDAARGSREKFVRH